MTQVDHAAAIWAVITMVGPLLAVLAAAWVLARPYRLVTPGKEQREWRAHRDWSEPQPLIIRAAHRAAF